MFVNFYKRNLRLNELINFLKALVGHIPGSLSHINILASMIFAGVSGSSTADTASIGSMMIPMMKKEGYPAGYSAAVTEVSSIIGPIIPPSNGLRLIPNPKQYAKWDITANIPRRSIYFLTFLV